MGKDGRYLGRIARTLSWSSGVRPGNGSGSFSWWNRFLRPDSEATPRGKKKLTKKEEAEEKSAESSEDAEDDGGNDTMSKSAAKKKAKAKGKKGKK